MGMITGWLSNIDIAAIVASAITFFIGFSIVKTKLNKALDIIGDLADVLFCIRKALADGNLSKVEIEEILKEGQELIAGFKK